LGISISRELRKSLEESQEKKSLTFKSLESYDTTNETTEEEEEVTNLILFVLSSTCIPYNGKFYITHWWSCQMHFYLQANNMIQFHIFIIQCDL
jgi:hypothetical protein